MSSSDPNRDDARAIEERSRRRKQDEISQLRDALKLIPGGYYQNFVGQLGVPAQYSHGQLVQWQVINIAAKAIK